jgi:hypothetical protein
MEVLANSKHQDENNYELSKEELEQQCDEGNVS